MQKIILLNSQKSQIIIDKHGAFLLGCWKKTNPIHEIYIHEIVRQFCNSLFSQIETHPYLPRPCHSSRKSLTDSNVSVPNKLVPQRLAGGWGVCILYWHGFGSDPRTQHANLASFCDPPKPSSRIAKYYEILARLERSPEISWTVALKVFALQWKSTER